MDWTTIDSIDRTVLEVFNGSDSLFVDSLAQILTSGYTWIPLYAALFYLIVKNNETMLQIAFAIGGAVACVILADLMADGIVKPLVGRWRPSNDPIIKYTIDIVNNTRGTDYGFFSAHAANTMSIALFFCLLVRNRIFAACMITWSVISCWTRMYMGLHYPGDIIVGLTWGSAVACGVYYIYRKLYYKVSPKINYISSQYTSTGYSLEDIDVVICTFAFIMVLSIIGSIIYI